jgi:hypothetical protein
MRVYSTSYHFLQLLVSLELKRGEEAGVEDRNGGREEEKKGSG